MDILDKIAQQVEKTIENGYYSVNGIKSKKVSLLERIKSNQFSLITEVKHHSPSAGQIFNGDVKGLVSEMSKSGSDGISVVVEPVFFHGKIEEISLIKQATNLPVLMKDFVIDKNQIIAASEIGADSILLIEALFERDYSNEGIDEMISLAHEKGLEVLLEIHSLEEFKKAKSTEADIIGINNRDLGTMEVDINNTVKILAEKKPDRPVISESGIKNRQDIRLVKDSGASAALVGSSILKSNNVSKKIQELLVV